MLSTVMSFFELDLIYGVIITKQQKLTASLNLVAALRALLDISFSPSDLKST